MAVTKGKVIFWSTLALLITGGSIWAYSKFIGKPKKDKDAQEKADADAAAASAAANKGGGGGGSGGGSGSSSTYTFPFKTEAEGNTFRAWVNKKDPTYAKSIDLSLTGTLNSYVQKAWDKYGVEYTKPDKVIVVAPPAATSFKVYANGVGTPFWNDVNDKIKPYRLAGDGEFLGYTTKKVYKSWWGNKFYAVTTGIGTKYVSVDNATFTP